MPIDRGQEWTLAGREHELRAIGAALERGGGVLLTGRSGVGRTRLLAAALERAAAEGRTVLTVGGAGRGGAAPVRAFGSLTGCLEWLRDAGAAGEAPGGNGTVLGCDDAHLLDDADAHRMYRTAAAGQVVVAATVRQDALPPAGVDRLWVEQLVERIEVAPFGRPEAAAVLRARLGGRVDAGSLERLWTATQGNALLLRELVEHALEDGSLRRVREVWTWPGLTGDPPRHLADVLLLWLRGLSGDEEELVGMLAVAEPLEADVVARCGLAAAAESLSRRGVVRVEQVRRRVRLRLSLPLAGRAVVARMSALTARRLRLQAADAIRATGARRGDDALRIVTLQVDAGAVPARGRLLEAARAAVRRQDFERAERLCRLVPDGEEPAGQAAGTGLEAGRDGSGDGGAALLLGRVLAGQGRHEEAEEVFAAALEGDGWLPDGERVAAVRARAANTAFGLGRVERASAVLEEAVERLGPGPGDALHGSRAVVAVLADRLEEAVAIGNAVLPGADGRSPAVQGLLPVVAFARAESGDPVGAAALLASFARETPAWEEEALLDFRAVAAHCALLRGDLQTASGAVAALGGADSGGLRQVRAQVLEARLRRALGRPEEAAALLWQAGAVRAGHDWLTTPPWILAQLAGALAEAGRNAEALRTLAEARAAQRGAVPYRLAADGIAFERALVLAHTGDRSGAAAQALEVAHGAAAGGRLPAALAALHLAARVSDAAPLAERARRLALRCDSEAARLQAEHVRALARSDAEALVSVAARLRSLGALPAAAEAAEQAGRAHRAAGRHRKGRLASAAARELCARFGGSLPPWAVSGERRPEAAAALTTREREVAALAASGLSNRDIADRLVVSVRTVENHLHRVYHKLGVMQRAELADMLAARPERPPRRAVGTGGGARCVMCSRPVDAAV